MRRGRPDGMNLGTDQGGAGASPRTSEVFTRGKTPSSVAPG